MAYLEIAKQELTKVGAALSKAMKLGEADQTRIMPLLKQLKNVNTGLEKVINGEEDDEFSFDEMEESAQSQRQLGRAQQKPIREEQDFGVDLGGFTDLMTPENNPDAFDWRATFREANQSKVGGVSVDMDEVASSELDGRTLGRMVDNT